MGEFTTLTSNTPFSWVQYGLEIEVAYNKRALALGFPSTSIHASPTTSMFDFIQDMQKKLEAIATYFADPDKVLAGESVLPENYETVDDFMTGAELTVPGYWKRSEGVYGQIQDKDIAGLWLLQDLQKALTHMTRVLAPYTSAFIEVILSTFTDPPPLYSLEPPTGEIDWEGGASSGNDYWANGVFHEHTFESTTGINRYWYELKVRRATITLTTLSTNSKNISVVAIPKGNSVAPSYFSDCGTGWVENETNIIHQVMASTAGSDLEIQLTDPITTWDDFLSHMIDTDLVQFETVDKALYCNIFNPSAPVVVVDYDFT